MIYSSHKAWFALGSIALVGLGIFLTQQVSREVSSAEPKTPTKEFECRWADGPIHIDGKADEETWKDAQIIDHFYLPWLGKDARKSKTGTKAKLLWDREYLYFFAEMEDTDLFADVEEHNGKTWENDVFELFFKPAHDKSGYYEFQVNAAGTLFDQFFSRRGVNRAKDDLPFHLEAKVRLNGTLNDWKDKDQSWSVEGKVPWRDFLRTGGRPNPNETWKFALCRYDYSIDFDEPELSTSAPLGSLNYPNFHQHEDYAALQFIGPPGQSRTPYGIEKRIPLTTSTVIGSPEPPLPYRVRKQFPKLLMNYPIAVASVPGSDQMLIITQDQSYGDTILRRTKGSPDTATSEILWKMKGTGYEIVFHPKFKENGFVYIGWNGPNPDAGKFTKVTRFTMKDQQFDLKSEKLIIEWPSDGHNGGAMCFGLDGMFYVTSGDGTSDSDTHVVGQDLSKLTAKVLRIDVDHPAQGKAYSIPNDNPFVGQQNVRPETWAYGLRNPWKMTADAKTGHIWVGNNGQDLWEQIFFVRKADNFGWSVYEGSHPFYLNRKLGPNPHTKPAFEHHHSEARSMTGGIVYYGKKFPELVGAYIYGDYSTGRIWAGKHDGTKVVWHKEIAQTRLKISGFGTDPQGEILICDHNGNNEGGFYTFEPTPKDLPPSKFPKKLSESGLFSSVKGHEVHPALIPYSVNAPFWSDGAVKSRWIALPGKDSKIEYTRSRGWNFPDETVIVKSFALEMEEGNSQSKKWIETRFLTRQAGEWFGYSYLWNDDQTDGILVDSKGMDKEYTIKTKDGEKRQKWHYPSRAECLVCHSRAANWVLGLCEIQMNKEHDYNGVRDHQFRVLEHLDLIPRNYAEETKALIRQELDSQGMKAKEIDTYLAKQMPPSDQRQAITTSSLLSFSTEKYGKLVDPFDPKKDLTLRAKSYLHSNCSSCHVEAGGGNAQMELEFATKLENMRILDVKPVHSTFQLPDARLVAPGHPERSVLLHRIRHRNEGHMPPLSTFIPDREGAKLIEEWIRNLKPKSNP